jgi:GNAT superfamily N-acetyltransferase
VDNRRTDPIELVSAPAAGIEVFPASNDRFEDMSTMLAPKRSDAFACWCLSYRIDPKVNQRLGPNERREYARGLTAEPTPPGVLAYRQGVVIGWAAIAPRTRAHALMHNSRLPVIDEIPVWSIWCVKTRPGYRRQGITKALISGAVDFAQSQGAPAVEAYPVENAGQKVDTTLAFVGTRSMFESAGFIKIADSRATSARLPRIIMRHQLD